MEFEVVLPVLHFRASDGELSWRIAQVDCPRFSNNAEAPIVRTREEAGKVFIWRSMQHWPDRLHRERKSACCDTVDVQERDRQAREAPAGGG